MVYKKGIYPGNLRSGRLVSGRDSFGEGVRSPWHTQQTVEALKRNPLSAQSDLLVVSDGARNAQIILSKFQLVQCLWVIA